MTSIFRVAIASVAVAAFSLPLSLPLEAVEPSPIRIEVIFTADNEVNAFVSYFSSKGKLLSEPLEVNKPYPVSVEVRGGEPGVVTARVVGSIISQQCIIMPGKVFTLEPSNLKIGPVVKPLK